MSVAEDDEPPVDLIARQLHARIAELHRVFVAMVVATRRAHGVSGYRIAKDLDIRSDVWARFETGRWNLEPHLAERLFTWLEAHRIP